MIPYFTLPDLQLPLGLKIDVFGVMSTAGVLVGAVLAARAARKYGPGNDEPLRAMVSWAVAFGLTGGHLMHLFAYHPELLAAQPGQVWTAFALVAAGGVAAGLLSRVPALKRWLELYREEAVLLALLWVVMLVFLAWQALLEASRGTTRPGDAWVVLRVWEGLSSMGGVLGAVVGISICFRRINQPWGPYLNALALGTAPGWTVARIGCFLVHDHPGSRTDFFLAVNFPAAGYGGPRHDLGLDDTLALLAITALLYALNRFKPKQGFLMGVLAMTYSASRFGLDFMRASDLSFVDRRYLGLTPAQYVVVGLFGVGVWLVARAPPSSIDSVQQQS